MFCKLKNLSTCINFKITDRTGSQFTDHLSTALISCMIKALHHGLMGNTTHIKEPKANKGRNKNKGKELKPYILGKKIWWR